MKIISRYLLKELLAPFTMGLFTFTFVMLTNAIIRLMDLLITKGVGIDRIAWLFLLSIPHILVLTIPMSVLLAILVAFGRLSHDSEITAMKASGISVMQMMKPVMLFAFAAWILTSVLFIVILPETNSALRQLRFDIIRTRSNLAIKTHVFNDDFDDLVLYVEDVERATGRMKNVFISSLLNKEEPEIIIAKSAIKLPLPGQERMILRLEDGFIHSIPNNNPSKYSINPFKTYDISLDMLLLKGSSVNKGDRELTIRELLEKAAAREQDGRNAGPQWVEIQKKFSIPFACFVFALLGVPLGITSRRSGKSVGFAISIGLFIVYYIFLAGGEGLGDEGTVPAWLAMWAPNLILSVIGCYLLFKIHFELPFKLWGAIGHTVSESVLILHGYMKAGRRHRNEGLRHLEGGHRRFQWRLGRILDRYVVGEFLRTFLLIMVSIIALSFIVHLFEKIDDLVELDATVMDSALAILYRVPFFMSIAIHFSVLAATLIAIGKLSRNSELTAMMASGISYPRLTAPILFVALLISGFSYVWSERVIPVCTKQAELQWNIIRQRENIPFIYNRRWFRGDKNSIFFFNSFDAKKQIMYGVSYFRFDDDGLLRERVEANQLDWDTDSWWYVSARILNFDEEGRLAGDGTFERKRSDIQESPQTFTRDYKESEEMNRAELRQYIKQLRQLGFDTTEYVVDLNTKLSLPLLSLVMAVIAVPFAYQSSRSGGLMGIGISLFIGVVYFIVFQVGVGLGHGGKLPPLLAAWVANALFFFSGTYLMLSTRR
ncbi:LPS export ABC transporter permease LptG [bacterium]|nr:LPS export ABC transporter permease LptG [candidate division CSSED10-310 bacterium]